MTSADGAGTRELGGWRGFLVPYAEIFRIPRAWRFSVAGVIGRLPMAMFGLGTVLLISAVTGRYGIAGSVSAVGVELRAPDWALFLAGIAGGAAMPALGPMARARWTALLSGSPRLHTAFSLESAADELCFVVGPATVTLLATELQPAAGVAAAALCCLAGTLWFAAQRETEPPAQQASDAGPRLGKTGQRALIPAPGLVVLIPVYLCLGAMFVAIDLSTVDFAARVGHHKPVAGLVLGCYALGSGIGGLWYGSRTWKAPTAQRLVLALVLTVAGVCTFWAMPDLLMLTAVIFLSGVAIAPTLIAGFSLLESQAAPGRVTEAMSWLSTGISVGVAFGATAVGFTLDDFGPRWGYGFAACCGGASVLVCLGGLRRLAVPA